MAIKLFDSRHQARPRRHVASEHWSAKVDSALRYVGRMLHRAQANPESKLMGT